MLSLVPVQFQVVLGTCLLQISVQTSEPDSLSPLTMLVQFETHPPHILPRKGHVSLLQEGSFSSNGLEHIKFPVSFIL